VTDVHVEWPVPTSGLVAPAMDLYLGQPVQARVKLEDFSPGASVAVSGLVNGIPWYQRIAMPQDVPDSEASSPLAVRWAHEQVEHLLDIALLSGQGVDSVREAVLALGLLHQLVTPFTSFIAVEQQISRPPWADAGEFRVPAMPPAGKANFASTALGLDLWLYLGVGGLLLSAFLIAMTQEDR
jgi:Ca-activated chloride channel family protein